MQALILIIHILVAISLIALVLLQHGKGADAGAAFGSGASNTMFGSTGSLPFLIKVTAVLAAIFFASSMALSYMVNPHPRPMEIVPAPTLPTQTVPAPINANPSGVPTPTQK
jgi:preprotein translocase subunit SecG